MFTLPELRQRTVIVSGAVTEQHTISHRAVVWSNKRRTWRQYCSYPVSETCGSENEKLSLYSSGKPLPVTNHSLSLSPSLIASAICSGFKPRLFGRSHEMVSSGLMISVSLEDSIFSLGRELFSALTRSDLVSNVSSAASAFAENDAERTPPIVKSKSRRSAQA